MDSEVKETISEAEAHYRTAQQNIIRSQMYSEVDSNLRTNDLLEAIAHALLGGLRDGLDYAAKQADRVEPGSPIYPGPEFEEDTTRP